MPPKQMYNKQDIIHATFVLIRQKGHGIFSIRNVATHIGCSSQPIYSFFTNKEELLEETAALASEFLLDRILEYRETNILALDMGLGYIQLMDEETQLFNFLLQRGHIVYEPEKQVNYLKRDELLKRLPEAELARLIKNICTFINGLLKTSRSSKETSHERELEMILAFRAFTLDAFKSVKGNQDNLNKIFRRISSVYKMRKEK